MQLPTFKNELSYIKKGFLPVGCDEVGRGPLAGPVVAAACILDHSSIGKYRSKNKWYARVRDSKTTNEEEREKLVREIQDHCVAFGVGEVWQEEIDEINIHHASRLAMKRAVEDLLAKVDKAQKYLIFIDGRFKIDIKIDQKTVVKGDRDVLSISAASIIAKVHRDAIMRKLHEKFPGYGFIKHKGYPTKAHQEAISKLGISPMHRKNFVK